MKKVWIFVLAPLLILSLAACLVPDNKNISETLPTQSGQNKSDVIEVSPNPLDPDKTNLENLVEENSAFAFNLYQTLIKDPKNQEQNLFYSPYSISLALAMTLAGARNETERQIAETMSFILPQSNLHPAFNSLITELNSRGKGAQGTGGNGFQLNMANALWGQEGYSFLPDFTDLLSTNYEAGLRTIDFKGAPGDSRITINSWVSDQTEDKIKDLIPTGAIDENTRLVLANAIYFNADWQSKFNKDRTKDDFFYLFSKGVAAVPMMMQTTYFSYSKGDDYQAVELLYKGNELSMVILLPRDVGIEAFEKSMDAKKVDTIINNLSSTYITLTMPKFKFESGLRLNDILSDMGMPTAFIPMPPEKLGMCSNEWADFSGMIGKCELYITGVFHKAFVAVDEEGTEAAAATAVIGGTPCCSVPKPIPIEVKIDHPFVFLIRDIKTGTILFLGRVMDPS